MRLQSKNIAGYFSRAIIDLYTIIIIKILRINYHNSINTHQLPENKMRNILQTGRNSVGVDQYHRSTIFLFGVSAGVKYGRKNYFLICKMPFFEKCNSLI